MWGLLFKDFTRKYCRTNKVIQQNYWTQSQPTNELHFCMLRLNSLKFRFHLQWHQKDKILRKKSNQESERLVNRELQDVAEIKDTNKWKETSCA